MYEVVNKLPGDGFPWNIPTVTIFQVSGFVGVKHKANQLIHWHNMVYSFRTPFPTPVRLVYKT